MRIGVFPMCADLLHVGHIAAIKEASTKCDFLIICLNCNPEGKEPIQSVFERWYQLVYTEKVGQVIPYAGEEDLELLLKVIPHQVRFVGSDYVDKDFTGKSYELEKDVTICYISRDHGLSTTQLKQRVIMHEKSDSATLTELCCNFFDSNKLHKRGEHSL